MAQKSSKDLVDKQGSIDVSITKQDVAEAGQAAGLTGKAKDSPVIDAPDAPRSVKGIATPTKQG